MPSNLPVVLAFGIAFVVVPKSLVGQEATLEGNELGAPYPIDASIRSVRWDPVDTIVRRAKGGDNWPVTWAHDGHLYSTYGDGFGFQPFVAEKLSLGLVRVTGGPPEFRGENVRSPSIEQKGAGRRGRKAWGILCVDKTLYMWLGHADLKGGQCQLAWSNDLGESWEYADWKFPEFGLLGFVNFGKNYEGARDGFVYAYSHDGPQADTPADRFVLLRCAKEQLRDRNAWQFFRGFDANQNPQWSQDITERTGVFEHKDACLRSAVTYNPGLKRYLWWQAIPQPASHPDRGDTRFDGGFGIYSAREPWGPWSTVYFTRQWDVGPGEHGDFPSKWMSPDGKRLWLVFSGDDCFSVRGLTLNTPDP